MFDHKLKFHQYFIKILTIPPNFFKSIILITVFYSSSHCVRSQDWNFSIGYNQYTSDEIDNDSIKINSLDDDNYGIAVELDRVINTGSYVRWSLELSLIKSVMSDSIQISPNVSTDTFVISSGSPVIILNNGDPDIIGGFTPITIIDPFSTATTIGFLDIDIDLSLYTIGLGINGFIRKNKIGLQFGVGPTVTYTDFRVEITESVSSSTGTTLYEVTRSSEDKDYIFGYYMELESQYILSDTFAIGLGYRYDYASDKARNRLANSNLDFDLEGTRIQLKLICSF